MILAFLALSSFMVTSAQDDEKKALTGNVLSASAFTIGNLTTSELQKFDTKWVQLPGYGITVGAGFQLNFNNSWSVETDFGYELNYYVYDRRDLRLEVGYKVPYVDLKFAKFFGSKKTTGRYWYAKFGAAYHFLAGQSLTTNEQAYQYELELAPKSVLTFMPEFGKHRQLGGNSSMQVALIGQYSPKTIMTATLHSKNELNSAIGLASGSYVGITFKYFFGIMSLNGKTGSGNGKDPKIRIDV